MIDREYERHLRSILAEFIDVHPGYRLGELFGMFQQTPKECLINSLVYLCMNKIVVCDRGKYFVMEKDYD